MTDSANIGWNGNYIYYLGIVSVACSMCWPLVYSHDFGTSAVRAQVLKVVRLQCPMDPTCIESASMSLGVMRFGSTWVIPISLMHSTVGSMKE